MAEPDTETYENWMKAVHIMFEGQRGLKGLNLHIARLIQQNALGNVQQGHVLNERGDCGTCLDNQETRIKESCIFNYVFGLFRFKGKEPQDWTNKTIAWWRANPWHGATIFMPDYYRKMEISDGTDINGFLNFMKNCNLFPKFLANLTLTQEVPYQSFRITELLNAHVKIISVCTTN